MMCFMRILDVGGLRSSLAQSNVGERRAHEETGEENRKPENRFFETPSGVVDRTLAAKDTGKSRAALLDHDGADEKYGDDDLSQV